MLHTQKYIRPCIGAYRKNHVPEFGLVERHEEGRPTKPTVWDDHVAIDSQVWPDDGSVQGDGRQRDPNSGAIGRSCTHSEGGGK